MPQLRLFPHQTPLISPLTFSVRRARISYSARHLLSSSLMSSLFSQPTSSLFGNNNSNNNNNQQQQNIGKPSLFGSLNTSTTSQPQQAGGLFGSTTTSQPQQGGSIFGSTTTSQPQSGAGLFGSFSTSQPQQGGGLFGSTATSQPQPGGFSASTASSQPQQGGGLFGSVNTSAPTSQEQQGTGLFGRITAPQPSGGGLFGSTQPQQQSGGLFQSQQQQQPQQGRGLFGTLGTNSNPQQQNQQQQGSSLFGNVGQPAPQQQENQQPGSVFGQTQVSVFQNENAPRRFFPPAFSDCIIANVARSRAKACTRTNRSSLFEMESSKSTLPLPNISLQHRSARAGAFLRPDSARRRTQMGGGAQQETYPGGHSRSGQRVSRSRNADEHAAPGSAYPWR